MKLRDIPVLSVPVICLSHYVTSFLWRYTSFYHYKDTAPYYQIRIKRQTLPGREKRQSGHLADVDIDMPLGDYSHLHESKQSEHVIVTIPEDQKDITSASEDALEPKVSWLQQTWMYAKSKLWGANSVLDMWAGAWTMANRSVSSMMAAFKMPFYYLYRHLGSIRPEADDDQ